MEIQHLPIESVTFDPALQPRQSINTDHWKEIAEWLTANPDKDTPPIDVIFDGSTNWAWEGFHRGMAYRGAHRTTISAIVQPGTKRDALLLSFGANAIHGLKRTDEDKRRAVKAMLADEEWSKWSARKISEVCAVSHFLVNQIRRDSVSGTGFTVSQIHQTTIVPSGIASTYPKSKESQTSNIPAPAASVKFERGGKVHSQRIDLFTIPPPPSRLPESDEENLNRMRDNFKRLLREANDVNCQRFKAVLLPLKVALKV